MISDQFEKRKQDHLQIAMSEWVQTPHLGDLDEIQLVHEALPEMNLQDVDLKVSLFAGQGAKEKTLSVPFFVSSMTAGHKDSAIINSHLAELSQNQNILVGVGSQRRELTDGEARQEWLSIRQKYPRAVLAGNLGLSQLISSPLDAVLKMIETLEPVAFFVHTNPLQEALQPEGTPFFRGGLEALSKFCQKSPVPVILKEVGCGFSESTLLKLTETGVAAVDVSGAGGTHWGRVEASRWSSESMERQMAETFKDWGHSAVESLLNAQKSDVKYQVWGSGGVRTGLDIAKMLALGATMVGSAQPWLQALYESDRVDTGRPSAMKISTQASEKLHLVFTKLEKELKIAMFCSGCQSVNDFTKRKVWKWTKTIKASQS